METPQCDWLTVSETFDHEVPTLIGNGRKIREDGPSEIISHDPLTITSQKGGVLQIRSINDRVYMSGNPSHWGKADNVFGVNVNQAKELYDRELYDRLGVTFTGEAKISRIDLCRNLATGGSEQQREFQKFLMLKEIPYMKKAIYGLNVQFRNGTRVFRAYDKGIDYDAKRKSEGYDKRIAAMLHDNGVIRAEWELRSQYLRNTSLRHWGAADNESAAQNYNCLNEVIMAEGESEVTYEERVESLSDRSRLVYEAWRAGANVREYMSNGTFYERRKEILAVTGHDIKSEIVVPIPRRRKTIEVSDLARPEWYGKV